MPDTPLDDSFLALLFNHIRGGVQPTGPSSQSASDDSYESWHTARTSFSSQRSSDDPSGPPASSSGTQPQAPASHTIPSPALSTPAPQGSHAYPLQEPSNSASPFSSIQSQTCRQRLLRVNPLLSRSSRAQTRITYDIMDRPGPGNVLDRLTRHPFALAPLLQPATYPPTARLILHSDKFPNVIVVDANVSKMNTRNHGGGGMRGVGEALGPSTVSVGNKDKENHDDNDRINNEGGKGKGKRKGHEAVDGMQYVSILDVLHAVHAGLSIPFSPTEWSALGGAKSWKAAKAYGRRMQAGGKGDWKRGVCHLDLLEGDTALVGIESLSVANAGSSVGLGRVFFGRPL